MRVSFSPARHAALFAKGTGEAKQLVAAGRPSRVCGIRCTIGLSEKGMSGHDISAVAGIEELMDVIGGRVGGWEFTGKESEREWQDRCWLWPNGGILLGDTLFLIYMGMQCSGERCDFDQFEWDGSQWIYPIRVTQDDPRQWEHEDRRLLRIYSGIVWQWMYDDTKDSGYVYVFGLSSAVERDALHVARVTASTIRDYASWEFLHKGAVAPATPAGFEEDWRKGNDSLSTLWVLATHVALEFSVHKLIVDGVVRWLLVHSFWSSKETPPDTPPEDQPIVSGRGILRLSDGERFTSFPDDENEENFFWVDVHDVDEEVNNGDPNFGALFRGFSFHSDLSAEEPAQSFEPALRSKRSIMGGVHAFSVCCSWNADTCLGRP